MTDPDKSPDPEKSKPDSGQSKVDWLEDLLKKTNFTKETIERLPTFEGKIPDFTELKEERFANLRAEVGEYLLQLLAHPEDDIRDVAAYALSKADNPNLHKQVIQIAQDNSAPFEQRLGAFDALRHSTNPEVQIFLAKFITEVVSMNTHLGSQKNNLDSQQIAIKILQREDLLMSAADAMQAIQDQKVLEIFESFASKGMFQTFVETLNGVTIMERKLHFEAVLHALEKPIERPTELVSKILKAAFDYNVEDIQKSALVVANRNAKLLTDDDFELILGKVNSWVINSNNPSLIETGKNLIFGEILSNAKDPEIRSQLRNLAGSYYPAHRIISLLSMKGTSDSQDLQIIAGAVERSENVLEKSIAISALGDWIKNNHGAEQEFAVDLLLKNLLMFEMSADCKVAAIEALRGVENKAFVIYCLEAMQGNDFNIAQTAASALEQDKTPLITNKLLEIIQDTSVTKHHAQELVSDTLAKRRDESIEAELCDILSSCDDSVAILVVNALKGTKHGPALDLLLQIAVDKTMHPALRADSIYSIRVSMEGDPSFIGSAFQRKFARMMGQIIGDKTEDGEVCLSAINAIPEIATTKVVNNLIEIAKSPDSMFPDAAIAKLSKMSHPAIVKAMKSIYEENPVIERKLLAIDKLGTYKNIEMLEFFLDEAKKAEMDLRTKFIESIGELLRD